MKLTLRDTNPQHLTEAAILATIAGLGVLLTSGFFIIWNGGWLSWVGLVLGFGVFLTGLYSMAREKQDEEESEEGA
jgi:CHASE2 domain-containing sensor protein